jgi:hypothetical protein
MVIIPPAISHYLSSSPKHPTKSFKYPKNPTNISEPRSRRNFEANPAA